MKMVLTVIQVGYNINRGWSLTMEGILLYCVSRKQKKRRNWSEKKRKKCRLVVKVLVTSMTRDCLNSFIRIYIIYILPLTFTGALESPNVVLGNCPVDKVGERAAAQSEKYI
tara:strand:- start:1091 stop:1426 length:336 start_codon:yes stop_codon:yes gene_type:complete